MCLCGTEHQRLLRLAYAAHKLFYACLISLSYHYVTSVEVALLIHLATLHFASHHRVVGRIDVLIYVALHVDVAEGCEESVFYSLLQ